MTPIQFSIHDNLTEAILHIEKAQDLIRTQISYSCQSVDIHAVKAAASMLASLRDVLIDVDQSALQLPSHENGHVPVDGLSDTGSFRGRLARTSVPNIPAGSSSHH